MKWLTLLAMFAVAAPAAAQTPDPHAWSRGTTLQITGGGATASPNTTGTFGTAIGWELTPRFEIEGAGAWLWQRHGTEGFAADMRMLVNLSGSRGVVPYVGGGAGLYRGTLDATRADHARFYERRIAGSTSRRMSYTDPTAVIVGGSHLYIAPHFSVRPEVALRIVFDDGTAYRVTSVTAAFVYHIEEHRGSMRRSQR